VQHFLFILLQNAVRMLQGMYCVREGDRMLVELRYVPSKDSRFYLTVFHERIAGAI